VLWPDTPIAAQDAKTRGERCTLRAKAGRSGTGVKLVKGKDLVFEESRGTGQMSHAETNLSHDPSIPTAEKNCR